MSFSNLCGTACLCSPEHVLYLAGLACGPKHYCHVLCIACLVWFRFFLSRVETACIRWSKAVLSRTLHSILIVVQNLCSILETACIRWSIELLSRRPLGTACLVWLRFDPRTWHNCLLQVVPRFCWELDTTSVAALMSCLLCSLHAVHLSKVTRVWFRGR